MCKFYSISESELDDLGVKLDKSLINDCLEIRKLALLDRVKLDESQHNSSLNKHLFDFIDYYGLDRLEVIKKYLANLQPYMIVRLDKQEYSRNVICVLDNLYMVSLYIKVDKTQFKELIVSFHESTVKGISRINIPSLYTSNRYIPVIASDVKSHLKTTNTYSIDVVLMRGFSEFTVNVSGKFYNNIFIVKEKYLHNPILTEINEYVDLLYQEQNKDLERDNFNDLRQLTFTSFGKTPANTISLLIDNYIRQKNTNNKVIADAILLTYVSNLQLTTTEYSELITVLEYRYQSASRVDIPLVLMRIKDVLDIPEVVEEPIEIKKNTQPISWGEYTCRY